MANDEQETLFDAFQAIAGPQYDNTAVLESEINVTTTLDELMREASQLTTGAGQVTNPVAAGEQTPDGNAGAGIEALVGNLRAGQQETSTADVNLGIDALVSSLHTTAERVEETSGGASSGGNTGSSAAPMSGLNVIDMSAEAGSRLNAASTTEAIYRNSSSGSSGGGGSTFSLVSSFLGGGLGMIPLIGGLLSLFGGGSSEPPPLEKYIKPDQLYFTGTDVGGSVQDADYDQFGMP